MNIAAILREIDAQIDRLQRARAILATPGQPASRTKKAQPALPEALPPIVAQQNEIALPSVTILSPKTRRGYRRTPKPLQQEPRALSSTVPAQPVFVPRAVVSVQPEPVVTAELNSEALEAALRQNFLGGAA